MKRLITAAAAVAVVALAGCSATAQGIPAPASPVSATTSTTAPTTMKPVLLTAEDKFYNQVMSIVPFEGPVVKSGLVGVGRGMCDIIGTPGYTRQVIIDEISKAQTNWHPTVTAAVLDAAKIFLCPTKSYVAAPVFTSTPAAPPAPVGPADVITGDGDYEVGVDIVPGKYKTAGSAQGEAFSCYWQRSPVGNQSQITANDIGNGPKTVTVKAGEIFSVARCGTWTLVK